MALDPQVHVTNGIPDVGTGNITTLGMTVAAQGASLATGGGNAAAAGPITGPLAQGGATSSAPTYTNATANPLSLDLSGNLRTVFSNTSIAVTGTFWQATQPVSGTVSVSGTVTVAGTVAVSSVSGTVAISAASLPLPSGAATSIKQPALGVAGTASLDVITVQGIASMTPLKVDGSATTQPISGNVGITGNVNCVQVTSPWVTSVSGNVTCVQSGNWTSRCVGNAGGIFDFSSAQNVTTPGQAILIGGEFNASPSTILTGNSSPLQLNSTGSLRVDGSLVTQPVSGTVTAKLNDGTGNAITSTAGALDINIKSGGGGGGTSSSFGSAFPASGTAAGAEYLSTPPTLTNGNMVALQTDVNGNLKVNIQAGAGSGGTASSVGGATPGQGTLAMGAVTTSAPSYTTATANALSLDTSGNLRTAVTNTVTVSGTVTANQGGAPWTMKPDGTAWTLTGTSANVNVTNSSVAVTQSGTWTDRIVGNTGVALDAAQNAAAPANELVVGGVYNITAPTLTSGNASQLQLTSTGSLHTNVDNTVNCAQQGTWSVNAVQSGNWPVRLQDGAGSPITSHTVGSAHGLDTVIIDGSGNQIGISTAPLRVDPTGTTTQPVSGTVTANIGTAGTLATAANQTNVQGVIGNATAPASMIVTGGVFNTTKPTLTTGQSAAMQVNSSGIQLMDLSLTGANATAIKVDGSGVTQPVNPATIGNWGLSASTFNTATPTNDVLVAGQYNSAQATMTSGNSSPLQVDKVGRVLAVAALRTTKGRQKTSITTNTAQTVVTAGAAGVFNDVYAIVVTNKSATSVTVDFSDGSGTVMTLAAPAGDTRGFTVPVDSAMPQSTAATAWTATVSAAVTSIEVTMLYAANL